MLTSINACVIIYMPNQKGVLVVEKIDKRKQRNVRVRISNKPLSLGQKLAVLRKEMNLTQAQVASVLNISRQKYSNVEDGSAYLNLYEADRFFQLVKETRPDLNINGDIFFDSECFLFRISNSELENLCLDSNSINNIKKLTTETVKDVCIEPLNLFIGNNEFVETFYNISKLLQSLTSEQDDYIKWMIENNIRKLTNSLIENYIKKNKPAKD